MLARVRPRTLSDIGSKKCDIFILFTTMFTNSMQIKTRMKQDDQFSQKLTISLPKGLVKKLDRLAKYDYVGRSQVIHAALLQYMRDPQNQLIAEPDSVSIAKLFEYIKDDHPYLDPTDKELIQFLYEQKINKEQGLREV